MLAALTNMFSGLWTLHTLLAATGQTTYEAIKGAALPTTLLGSLLLC